MSGLLRGRETVVELARRYGVSRRTAYKWKGRFEEEGARGLVDRRPVARRVFRRLSKHWESWLRQMHRRHPRWGPRKLWCLAHRGRRRKAIPSESTFKRWFCRWGWVRRRPRRVTRGTVVVRPRVRLAHHPNQVWTVDFKGWFRTGDRRRIEPLTVRDLYSRKVIRVMLLPDQKATTVLRAMRRIFVRNGLPERIRCDNGYPFGSIGSMGLSRLSAWWLKLGIAVDFIDPGHPDQNGSHEQMHRILKADTANPPAANSEAQRKRTERWVREYNKVRPHDSLGIKVPAEVYRVSRRRLPSRTKELKYPAGWERKWVKGNGEICLCGRRWFVGEAYAGEYVGLKPSGMGNWKVYFGKTWIGELREKESGSIRPRVFNRKRQQKRALRFRRASPARSASLRSPSKPK